jgi:predicted enzyme related to lactoylglutathione lyase
MFQYKDSFSSFSVDDIGKAKEFYGQVLGFKMKDQMGGLDVSLNGGGKLFIYAKTDHTPATHTVLNLVVDDIDQAVDALAKAGVIFEKYDTPNMKTDEKGVARGGGEEGPTMAWFKDPAGNFLSVLEAAK